jgi:hypothetical protein
VGCGLLLSTPAVCPKAAVAHRKQKAKNVVFIMILSESHATIDRAMLSRLKEPAELRE